MLLTLTCLLGLVYAQAQSPWGRGHEDQRVPDFGNGSYLNPILAGDHPDPSVLKVGKDYYMVHSSFDYVPGLLVWHSLDLVNWEPVTAALNEHVGIVWAPDLSYHEGKFHIYFPVLTNTGFTNMVVTASDIRGPWSIPIDLKVGNFDPGHAVSTDGTRYLFFNAGSMARLSTDGLKIEGPVKHVYDGWPIPEHWAIETFGQEGPKMLRHGDYYYMVLAEGGTAGPATSHMVIMARSKSLEGPWENSPYNPIVRTQNSAETWWSKGHGTLVEGPDGEQWYLVYHAYEKNHYNLGRQTLLEPVEWTADGWLRATGHDVAKLIPKPAGGASVQHGVELTDHFSANRIGTQWVFFRPSVPVSEKYRYETDGLVLKASGSSPKDSSPLLCLSGDHAYEMEVEIERDENATAALLLFYSEKLFAGLGFSKDSMVEYWKGDVSTFTKPGDIGRHFFLRLRNDHDLVTVFYSADGKQWTKHWMNFEVSGYHHNVGGGFLSLRPGLLAAGSGDVRFRHFKYRALP